jgi:hypothetical protein
MTDTKKEVFQVNVVFPDYVDPKSQKNVCELNKTLYKACAGYDVSEVALAIGLLLSTACKQSGRDVAELLQLVEHFIKFQGINEEQVVYNA